MDLITNNKEVAHFLLLQTKPVRGKNGDTHLLIEGTTSDTDIRISIPYGSEYVCALHKIIWEIHEKLLTEEMKLATNN